VVAVVPAVAVASAAVLVAAPVVAAEAVASVAAPVVVLVDPVVPLGVAVVCRGAVRPRGGHGVGAATSRSWSRPS